MAAPRICPHCGTANEPGASFCGACATQLFSTSTALTPVRHKSNLPALTQREKATLGGVAVGMTAVALRVGAALLKQFAERKPNLPAQQAPEPPPKLVVRRRWVVGDATGATRWGEEEVEVHHPDDAGTYRVWLGRSDR
jgi:hypothetical protein